MKHLAIINPEADSEILDNLRNYDIEPIPIDATPLLDEPLSGHADLQVFILDQTLYCHPGISTNFVKRMEKYGDIIICKTPLGSEPVKSIPYCIAYTGGAAFHRTEYTDHTIKKSLADGNIPLYPVKQGFSRCATLIMGERRIITEDMGILKASQGSGMTSLLVNPGYIPLKGYRHGFIGGASGYMPGRVFLTGTLDHHPDRDRIISFIETGGQSLICLSKKPAMDIGSILIFPGNR